MVYKNVLRTRLLVLIITIAVAFSFFITLSVGTSHAQSQNREALIAQINELLAIVEELKAKLAAQRGYTCTPLTGNYNLGDKGPEILQLQRFLNSNPSTRIAASGPGSPGNETDYYGTLTSSAVKRYQELHMSEILTPVGLSRGSGYFGPSTRTHVNRQCQGDPGDGVTADLPTGEGLMCPADARMCPDGTSVGRTGPNCSFPACPSGGGGGGGGGVGEPPKREEPPVDDPEEDDPVPIPPANDPKEDDPVPTPPTVTMCGDSTLRTPTNFIRSFIPSIRDNSGSGKLSCSSIPKVPYDPYMLGFKTPNGVTMGVGAGGQIYSITMPGVSENIIPPGQKDDSHWNDRTLLMTATPGRGYAQKHPGGNWFLHQSGTYSRGPLNATDPAFYSPIMHRYFSADGGYSETLNLSQMSHIDNTKFIPDRFPMYAKYRHIGDDIFEVTYIYFNHSKLEESKPYTELMYINTPWFTVHKDAVPFVVGVKDGGDVLDISDMSWAQESTKYYGENFKWVGAFTSGSSKAPGIAMTLPQNSNVLFRGGSVSRPGQLIDVTESGEHILGPENWFIWDIVKRDELIERGDTFVSRFYLLFGERNTDIANKAQQLSQQSFARKIDIPQSNSTTNVIELCKNSLGRYGQCGGIFTQEKIALGRNWCSKCLPVYEVRDINAKRFLYSTDPYMGRTDLSHITKNDYKITRIIGWLYHDKTHLPSGYQGFELRGSSNEPILIHNSDRGKYLYLKK